VWPRARGAGRVPGDEGHRWSGSPRRAALRGRPRPPRRATATASSSWTSSRVSALAGGQVAGQVATTSVPDRVDLRGPPAPRLAECFPSRCATAARPLYRHRGVLMSTHNRGGGVRVPVQLSRRVRVGPHRRLDPRPGTVFLPPHEPLVQRLPRPVPLRHIAPRSTDTNPEQDPADDLPMIPPPPTTLRRHGRQQRRDPYILRIG
jgi:hypothetical protein